VLASDGERVGTVHHVVSAPEKDIFHGVVISTPDHGLRFVEAADVESLHEFGVDLRIDSAGGAEPAAAWRRGGGVRRGPWRDEGLASLVHKATNARATGCASAEQRARARPRDRRQPQALPQSKGEHATEEQTVASCSRRCLSRRSCCFSPLAARSYPPCGRGRRRTARCATPFQRDRDRIVHSKAFRRLTHKKQVFVAPAATTTAPRLTHTLAGDEHLAHGGAGAALERGPGGGRSAWATTLAPAVWAHRRGGAGRL